MSLTMWKRIAVTVLLLAAFGATRAAAQSDALPGGVVGVPYSYSIFPEGLDNVSQPGLIIQFRFSATGNVPPGLTMNPNGTLSGTPTLAGTFSFSIVFGYHVEIEGEPPIDFSFPIPVSLTVLPGTGPATRLDPQGLVLSLNQGTGTATQTISVSNRGSGTRSFTSTVSAGAPWLTVSPAAQSIPSFGAAGVTVNADTSRLQPGTYTASIRIALTQPIEAFDVPVVATVSSARQSITLTQTGFRFQTVIGGPTPPAQVLSIFNGGTGTLPITVTSRTISGGSWLSATAATNAAGAQPADLTVTVNPARLPVGDYYGTVQVASPGVDNSPQTISVVLNVVDVAQSPGAQLSATGFIFVGSAGPAKTAPKTVTIQNPSPRPLTFSTSISYDVPAKWLSVMPVNGTLNQTSTLTAQADVTGLGPGTYKAEISVRFAEDSSIRRIAVLLVVTPAGFSFVPLTEGPVPSPLVGTCTPTKLLPVFTKLGSGFAATAAWPVTLEATVVDDCGTPMTTGSVSVSFSSADPAQALTSLKDGRWTGTWQPRSNVDRVTLTVNAQQALPPLKGSELIGGGLTKNEVTPVIAAGGALSAASFVQQQPLAPGSYAAIFGSNLGNGISVSPKLPLEIELGKTSVILGGRQLPLQFASNGQINAIIPYDVPVNTTQQMIVQFGNSISVPEPVIIASAQPALFTEDRSGKGRGIIVGVRPDGTAVPAGQPVSADFVIVIYCSGLGAVDPPVSAGTAASLSVLSRTVNPVTVTIGGRPATVAFAGLAPGFSGLYQINAVVPSGLSAGDLPVVVTVAGQSSTPVTLPVR